MTTYCKNDIEFISSQPLDYYKTLPSTEHSLTGDWPQKEELCSAVERVKNALSTNQIANSHDISTLQAGIFFLASTKQSLPEDSRWSSLSELLSKEYAKSLGSSHSDHKYRMSIQRLNYYIQFGLGQNLPHQEKVIKFKNLEIEYCWDYIQIRSNEQGDIHCYISSQKGNNFHLINSSGVETGYNVGLPTQMDISPNGKIYIGSCYSNGYWEWEREYTQPTYHDLEEPIVLSFDFEDKTWNVASSGVIYRQGVSCFESPVEKVWTARQIDKNIFLSDWSIFGKMYKYNLQSKQGEWIDISPIHLLNDICRSGDFYYMIDKQKGAIFKFDENFNYINQMLNFGSGQGKLFDPISLRADSNTLGVISWITSEYNQIEIF